MRIKTAVMMAVVVLMFPLFALAGQMAPGGTTDTWITAEDGAAGPRVKAEKEAVQAALRKCVEQACGVFIRSQSRSQDYKLIYDKVIANTPGYVLEYKIIRVWEKDGITWARVSARVSNKKFSEEWARIAHTIHQEGNPRVIIAVAETTWTLVNTLDESNSSTTSTVVSGATDQTNTVTAAEIQRARTLGERYTWVDRRGRRWRQRGGGQVYVIDGAVADRESIAAAQAHFRAVFAAVAVSKTKDNRDVWKKAAEKVAEGGTVQTKLEEFFLEKGVKLMDRGSTEKVDKRDLILVASGDNAKEIAAIKARFNTDVIIMGTAAAKLGSKVQLADYTMYQYSAKLVIRAIRTDTGQILAAKTIGPINVNSMKKAGGEDEALAKLADKAAPQVLEAIVEGWRKQVNVSRDIKLYIGGMTFEDWKAFKQEVEELKGIQALRLREITNSIATIDVEYDFDTQQLAERLTDLKKVKLQVTELNPDRLKLKISK